MEKLIGIVVPPEIKADMVQFGQKYGCAIEEPHIALIPYEMLKRARGVDRNLQSYCLSQPPFKAIIGGPSIESTDERQIFNLTVMMGTLNSVRERLIKHLKLPPYSGLFKPNVSLIEQKPDGGYDFQEMLADAKTVFSKPCQVNVDALAIYTRANRGEPYKLAASYQFTGR